METWALSVNEFQLIEKNEDYAQTLETDFANACREHASFQGAATDLHVGNVVQFMLETDKQFKYADFDICGTIIHKGHDGSTTFKEALDKFVSENLQSESVLKGTVSMNRSPLSKKDVENSLREVFTGRSGFAFRQIYNSNPDKLHVGQGMYRFALATWPEGDQVVYVEPEDRQFYEAKPQKSSKLLRVLQRHLDDRSNLTSRLLQALGTYVLDKRLSAEALHNAFREASNTNWGYTRDEILGPAQEILRKPDVQRALRELEEETEPVLNDTMSRVELPSPPTPENLTELALSENVTESAYA